MTKVATTYGVLLVGNLAAWGWAWIAFADRPALLGTAFLAYVFGLRHAFDADHIAAIDNVIRKLMQEGKRRYAVGFFFSLGHSTIVVLASVAIAATAAALQGRLDACHDVGGVDRHVVSALFLLLIGIANLFILRGVWAAFIRVRDGEAVGRRGSRRAAGRPRPARPPVPARVPRRSRSAGTCIRSASCSASASTPRPKSACSASRPTQAAQGMSFWSILVFPGAVHRRHVADRHHRQRADGARLWLGLRQSDPQALVQPDHHRRVGRRRALHRRHRGAGPDRRQARPRGRRSGASSAI